MDSEATFALLFERIVRLIWRKQSSNHACVVVRGSSSYCFYEKIEDDFHRPLFFAKERLKGV